MKLRGSGRSAVGDPEQVRRDRHELRVRLDLPRRPQRGSRHSASSGSVPRSPHSHAGPSTPTTRTSSNPASRISSASCGRRVEERCREPTRRAIGVAVRASPQVTRHDRPEAVVGDHPFPEAAEHRRQPRYRRRDHGPPRTDNPRRLAQHCHSIEAVEQVIERPEQEHVVERRVGMRAAALLHRAQPAPARAPLPARNGAAPDRAA